MKTHCHQKKCSNTSNRNKILIGDYIKDYIRIKPKLHAMSPNQLTDFVHNKAQAGDIAITHDSTTNKKYMYFCNEKNIGKDINPVWMMIDEREMLKNMFENMTLEQKVDFLIDKYIQDNT